MENVFSGDSRLGKSVVMEGRGEELGEASSRSGKGRPSSPLLPLRVQMLRSVFSSAFGMLGAIYCVSVSGVALRTGPICLKNNEWAYHFEETS